MVRKNKNKSRNRSKLQWVVKSKPDGPGWIDLPRDITTNILGRLDTVERLHSAYNVCTTWRAVCRDNPHMWRVVHMSKSACNLNPHQLETTCRNAVYCSQGQLVHITMDGFCTDALLRYISKSCSQLQSLRIAYSVDVSDEGLIEALKRFSVLNELYLFSLWSSGTRILPNWDFNIKDIGCCCPMLKSFTFTYRVDGYPMSHGNRCALAVAQNMPGLNHLRLLGNPMSMKGLKAILDQCSQLESLDIRLCKNLDHDLSYEIDTTERCRRIRQVWLPNDSCSDHEFYDRLGDIVSWFADLRESGNYSPQYGWS